MSTIVLRSVKGSPLTNTEVDTNFSNLNTDKLEAGTTATLTNKTISGSDNTISNLSLTASVTGTLPVANGGTGLTTYTPNGILYASGSGTLATGSVLTFDGTNVINSGAYTAPSNGAGAGTKTTIQGSTGTGAACPSGGNGFIELIGGGGTNLWTNFSVNNARRRGGIYLQAGTAQGDAGGTYVNGSTINIAGSSGTNNGTTTGLGSNVTISSGSTAKIDGFTSSGGSISLNNSSSGAGSSATIASGGFATAGGTNGNSQITLNGATATAAGNITLTVGAAGIAGSTAGKAFVNTGGVDSEILTTASTVAVANGGTGATTAQTAMNTLAAAVTSGYYLRGDGTNVVMSAIQAADVPTLNQNTTGNADNVTGIVAIANGGTGQTTAGAAITALTGTQVAGQYLRSDGTNASLSAIQAADVPTLNQNTTGNAGNVTGTVAVANGGTGATSLANNNVILGNGTSAVQTVAPGTTGNVLTSDGTTWVSSPAAATGVTSVSVATANGFAGTSSGGSTPILTMSTSITGLLQGDGTAVSAVTIGSGLSFSAGTLSATSTGSTSIGLVRAVAINCILL
jgi:hypothetical protein